MPDEPTRIIPTAIGPVLVTIQNGRTAYVRAGTGDTCTSSVSLPADELEPVVVRGTPLRIRAHFRLTADGWGVPRSYGGGITRAESYADATPTMIGKARDAIVAALTENVTADELAAAATATAIDDANRLESDAAKLRNIAKQLEAQAKALRKGGRTVYLDVPFTNGHRESVRTVELPNGKRLHPADEPPDMRTTSCRYRLTSDQLAAATERD